MGRGDKQGGKSSCVCTYVHISTSCRVLHFRPQLALVDGLVWWSMFVENNGQESCQVTMPDPAPLQWTRLSSAYIVEAK